MKRLLAFSILITVLLVGAFFARRALLKAKFAALADPEPLALGSPAPDFSLPGVDGKIYTLADFKDARALLVVFIAPHCPTATGYEPKLKQITADFRPRGLATVAIMPNDPAAVRLDELCYSDLGDSFEEMKKRAADSAFNFPWLYDGETQRVSRSYGPKATPHCFLFDASRRLRYVGRIDDNEDPKLRKTNELPEAIEAVLAGRDPAIAQTRVWGCSIKWSGLRPTVLAANEAAAKEPVSLELADRTTLAALRKGDGKTLRLINVWATWCGPCVAEFPALVDINRMFRPRAFEFISVSANKPEERPAVEQFLQRARASNRNLLYNETDRDALFTALDEKAGGSLPLSILVNGNGEIIWRKEGPVDPAQLRRLIADTLGRIMPREEAQ